MEEILNQAKRLEKEYDWLGARYRVSTTFNLSSLSSIQIETSRSLKIRVDSILSRGSQLRRLYPKQPIVGVGAVAVCSSTILLEKRKNEPGKGKWSIPGGLVELGEEAEETVIREVWEETRLRVEKPELIDVVNNVELDEDGKVKYHFVIIDYFVKLKGGKLKAASDAAELRWVRLDDVESYVLTGTFQEFFMRNYEKLKRFNSYIQRTDRKN